MKNERYKLVDSEGSHKFTLESGDNASLTAEDIEDIEFKMLTHNNLKNTLHMDFIEKDKELSIIYNYDNYISLTRKNQHEEMTYNDFYQLTLEICNTLKNAPTHMLQAEKYSLEEDRIYVGKRFYDVKLVYIPMVENIFEENLETRLKRLIFTTINRVKNISNSNYLKITNFLRHPNFSITNFKNLLMEIGMTEDNYDLSGNSKTKIKNNIKYKTKKVNEIPEPTKKEKLYSSLIAALLLAVIWSQMPLGSDVLLGTAFLLSVVVIILLYIYWKKWRPGAEQITVEKKVKVKEKKNDFTELDDQETELEKINKIKLLDFYTFINSKELLREEHAYSIEMTDKTDFTENKLKQMAIINEHQDTDNINIDEDEIESFTITDQTTLLDDEDLKHNVRIGEIDSKFRLLAQDESFEKDLTIPIFGNSYKIGREREESDYVIKDQNVSRKHIEFVKENDAYVIRDNGSINGTSINNTKLMPFKLYPINSGDVISIGDLKFEYIIKDQ